MKTQLTRFAKDTDGMLSIDWIGLVAGVAISASSAVTYIGDHITSHAETLSTDIHQSALCPDELHVVHKDNGVIIASDYFPPKP